MMNDIITPLSIIEFLQEIENELMLNNSISSENIKKLYHILDYELDNNFNNKDIKLRIQLILNLINKNTIILNDNWIQDNNNIKNSILIKKLLLGLTNSRTRIMLLDME